MLQCYEILVFFLQLPRLTNSSAPVTLPSPPHPSPSPRRTCGGVTVADTFFKKPIGPPQNPPDNDPAKFTKFKVLFLIDPGIDEANRKKLEIMSIKVQEELEQMMRGPKLNEIRFHRYLHDTNSSICAPRRCAYIPIPAEYSMPCTIKGRVVPDSDNVTAEPSDRVKKWNTEGEYSMVALVAVKGQGWLTNAHPNVCPDERVAEATSCQGDPNTERPDHGGVIWCRPPIGERDAPFTFLHEVLHILLPTLVGAYDRTNECWPQKPEELGHSCEGKTWIQRNANWMLQNGSKIILPTYFVTMGNLPQVVQEYLQCPNVPGAPLNANVKNGVSVPDFAHWSYRFFPDDVLSPYSYPDLVVTNVTLAALATHKNWYTVNFRHARPLVRSRGAGCGFLNKSCYEMFKEARARRNRENEVMEFPPYCDDAPSLPPKSRPILTSLCSQDHKEFFECHVGFQREHDYCPMKARRTVSGYDHWTCEKTGLLNSTSFASLLGGSSDQSNKVVNFTLKNPACALSYVEPITVICPDYDRVCRRQRTVKTAPQMTTTSAANWDVQFLVVQPFVFAIMAMGSVRASC